MEPLHRTKLRKHYDDYKYLKDVLHRPKQQRLEGSRVRTLGLGLKDSRVRVRALGLGP